MKEKTKKVRIVTVIDPSGMVFFVLPIIEDRWWLLIQYYIWISIDKKEKNIVAEVSNAKLNKIKSLGGRQNR